ncbi:MAG: addiction module protein [Chthoniobacteraceae bacterium]
MILEQHPELQHLSPSQKLLLVTELWDDLAVNPEKIPVTRQQMDEIDRRLEAYRNDPSEVTTWDAIKARILGSGDCAG